MQLHCLHATAFGFETRKRDVETPWGRTEASVGDSLVVLVAVEPEDSRNPELSARAAADRIEAVAENLGERTIVLVPCPYLTDSPADGDVAEAVLRVLDGKTKGEVHTVAPGYDVAFDLDARGHPFASQHVRVEPGRQAVEGDWLVVSPETGGIDPVGDGTTGGVNLDERKRALVEHDHDRTAVFEQIGDGPAFFEESPEESGRRLLPGGVLGRDILIDRLETRLLEYGAVPVEGYGGEPACDVPSLVGEQHLQTGDLPLSVFSTRGFAVEGDGSRQGTPTLATFAVDTREALDELLRQAALLHGLLGELGIDYEPVIRTGREFYDDHSGWLSQCCGAFGRSVLVERRADSSPPLEIEFAVQDGNGTRLVAPTVTLAGERPESSTADGEDPVVVRSTPLDAPERLLAGLAAQTASQERPQLPTWLAPVQLRLVPIDSGHVTYCEHLAETFETAGIRVDVDDRDLPVSERLRDSETTWIPYDAVVGDENVESNTLGVTIRSAHAERAFSPDELRDRIRAELDGWPEAPLPLPRRLSRRPAVLERD